MGEAKRRKEVEPNYGYLPKDEGYRGLIVSPPIEIEGTKLFAKSSNLDPQELRFALLFWDRLVWPSSRSIHFASNDDESYLESAGILERPDYTMNGDVAEGIALGQIKAFQDFDQKAPGMWSLAQGDRSFVWKGETIEETAGTAVELHRAIPIPRHDVPLAEILEFKERRRDELLNLRHKIESFIVDIEKSDDRQAILQSKIVEIDQACANLLIVGREWQSPVYLSNFKISFSVNVANIIDRVSRAWKLCESYGLDAAAAAAGVAGVLSVLDFKAEPGFRSIKCPMSPYKYAYRIDRELR